jgi:Lrp/AsnC family transcriptional regulator for asnA, asnC and gidA
MDLLNSKIQEIKGVTETETMISLRTSLNREIPIDTVGFKTVDIDDEKIQ